MVKLNESAIDGEVVCHDIPESGGVYLITGANAEVLYVGSTNCLRRRIAYLEGHIRDKSSGGFLHDASDPLLQLQASGTKVRVHYMCCSDYEDKARRLKAKYDPPWNKI
jgi:GIY-YIG catalytic domain